ncbi:MAG: hypothetical protein ACT4PJ_10620 [Gemmatimonadaceae bacterium]
MIRSGSAAFVIAGPRRDVLSRLGGVEVLARGREASGVLTVTDFTVTSVHGEPVLDGRLVEEGDRLILVASDGRRVELRAPPDGLRAHGGHRVWVRTSPSGEPEAWRRID